MASAQHCVPRPLIGTFAAALLVFAAGPARAQETGDQPPPNLPQERVCSAWPQRLEQRGNLSITVGPIRTVMRAARTPMVVGFDSGVILLTAGSKAGGAHTIRSEDRGNTWREQGQIIAHLNTLALRDGPLLVIEYNPKPLPDRPGQYEGRRWLSTDQGRTLPEAGSFVLSLPPDRFDPKLPQWFHGNLIQMPEGDLLTIMQGQGILPDGQRPFRTFLVRSGDEGRRWELVSMVADHAAMAPIVPALRANGWRLHGAVEPTLLHIGRQELLCIARVVDDESNLQPWQLGKPSETYHDLSYTVSGDGIYPGLIKLPKDRYYTPGPPSAPLILSRSTDGGRTWSAPAAMKQARGCFPRTAISADGIIALTYGGSGAPRWGNFIAFSTDRGNTWTDEINFGPFLTTGYTAVVSTGPGQFVCFFDCTPPQPWTNDAAWWIGAVDITVTPQSSRPTPKD